MLCLCNKKWIDQQIDTCDLMIIFLKSLSVNLTGKYMYWQLLCPITISHKEIFLCYF